MTAAARSMLGGEELSNRGAHAFLIGFSALAILTAALSFAFYRHELAQDRDTAFQELAAVVELKVDQIDAWLWERRTDAKLLSSVQRFGIDLEEMIVLGQVLRSSALYRFLSTSSSVYGYRSAFGLDPEGNVAFTVGDVAGTENVPAPLARLAIERNEIVFSPLYRDESTTERPPLLDIAVPLYKAPDAPATGIVVLRINARAFFLPLIKQLPLSLSAAQIHLVRRAGDEILHLSEETHKGERFPMRVSAKDETLASVQAIQGAGRQIDAMDHRGIRVLAASQAIEGSDWVLIAKIDASVVDARALKATFVVSAFLFLLLGGGGGFVAMRWAHREREHEQRRRLDQLERDALVHHFDYLAKYANDGIILMDGGFRIREVNERVSALLGYSRDELLWTDGKRLHAPDLQDRYRADWAAAGSADGVVFETRMLRKNGTAIPVEVSGRLIEVEGERYYQAIVRDITERKEAEARIGRLVQIKGALSRINAATVRAPDEQALFKQVCAIVVEQGGFDLAAIGMADPISGEVRWDAAAGTLATAFVQSPRSVRPDDPDGCGPTGIACRERRSVIVQDFQSDPLTVPWWDLARSLGIGSTAAFPILRAGDAIGVFHVNSRAAHAFDDEVVELLEEAVREVSFALDNFARERSRQRAKARAAELESIVNRSPAVFLEWGPNLDRPVKFVSENIAGFGYAAEDLTAGNLLYTDIVHPEDRADYVAAAKRAEQTSDSVISREYRIRKQSGETRWVEERTWPQRDASGWTVGYQGLIEDVTARKLAEAALRESEERYRDLIENSQDLICTHTLDGRLLSVNAAALRLTGYSREALLGMNMADLLTAGARAGFPAYLAEIRANSRASGLMHIVTADGSTRWWEYDNTLRTEGVATPVVRGMARDVTERRAAERRVAHLTRLYATISSVNQIIVRARGDQELFHGICRIAVQHGGMFGAVVRLVDADTSTLQPVAFSESMRPIVESLAMGVDPSRPEARSVIVQAYLEDTITIDNAFSERVPDEPWRALPHQLGIRSIATLPVRRGGKPVGIFGIAASEANFFDTEFRALLEEMAVDIEFALDNFEYERRRKQAEEFLHESEARFRALTELSADYFWEMDEKFRYTAISDEVESITGYSPKELIGRDPSAWIPMERLDPPPEEFARIRAEHKPYRNATARVQIKNGSHVTLSISADPIFDEDGEFRGYRGVSRDTTERAQSEAALRESEERFRGLVEQSISGIVILQDGRYAYVNPRAVEIFGYDAPEEMVGRETLEFVAEQDRALVTENIRRRLSGEVKAISYGFVGLRKDGTTVDIGAHGTLATYRGRPAIIGVIQDITDRKRAEEAAQRYLAEIERAMRATVGVASNMGEMRDPYTAGHQRRVAELTAAIGEEMGLSASQVEGLRVAGNLHDIGKITVPAEILAKPGKISAIEFNLIKEHAQQGYEILKDVRFPWPVAEVAQQHHERLDGSGYPQELKGDEIVLEARILAVADTVEAMSSHRPYRPGRGLEASLAEVEKLRGTKYDTAAVDACLRLFREKGYRLPN